MNLSLMAAPHPMGRMAADTLKRAVSEGTGIRLDESGPSQADILLDIEPGLGSEGFEISGAPMGTRIRGDDGRGLLYGIGRFLRDARMAPGQFKAGTWRGVSVPDKPLRGIYLATHFHNFYHDAPVRDVERYIEDLALWGCNALTVFLDLHHFDGIDDPECRAMIDRLRAYLLAAGRTGMDLGLVMAANEAFRTSPAALRADYRGGQNGYTRNLAAHFRVEICPSRPTGLDEILRTRRQVLDAFRDLPVRHLWIWPYDSGGCTCADCAPWAGNGFLRCAEPLARVGRELFPDSEIILSTWFFDHFTTGEWDAFGRFLSRRPDWIDKLLVEPHGRALPYAVADRAELPVCNFPEISMAGMLPWGGFGANPRPLHWQEYWRTTGRAVQGGFPYSEGIFEDINKVLILQLEWDPQREAAAIVREYAASYFGERVADTVCRAVLLLEQSLGHQAILRQGKDDYSMYTFGGRLDPLRPWQLVYQGKGLACALPAVQLLDGAESLLPADIRTSWRWRILRLRALIDEELQRDHYPNERLEAALSELASLYRAERVDEPALAPPALRAIERLVRIVKTSPL